MTETPLQRAQLMTKAPCYGHHKKYGGTLVPRCHQIECPHCVAKAIDEFRRDAVKAVMRGLSLAGDKVATREPLSDSDARASAVAHLMAAASLLRVRLESPDEAEQLDEMARGVAQ